MIHVVNNIFCGGNTFEKLKRHKTNQDMRSYEEIYKKDYLFVIVFCGTSSELMQNPRFPRNTG